MRDEPAPAASNATPAIDRSRRAATRNVRPERAQRCATPRDERPDPHQQQQRQPERVQEEVVVRLARPSRPRRVTACGQDRIDDAPEDRQRERDEQQVVVEERRLARDERLEPRLRAQQRQPREDERERAER